MTKEKVDRELYRIFEKRHISRRSFRKKLRDIQRTDRICKRGRREIYALMAHRSYEDYPKVVFG